MSTVTLVKQGGNPTFTSLTVIQGITGSLYGTASHAVSASYTPGSGAATSASYAATASLPLLGIVTASVSSTTITFTRGDSTTFNITVAQSGSVSSASYANTATTATNWSGYNAGLLNWTTANGTSTNGQNRMAARLYSLGRKIYLDETFNYGINSLNVYDNNSTGTVSITRVAAPYGVSTSGYQVQIQHTGASQTPGYGGFYFATQTRSNATFACVFRAKLASGYTLNWASNAIGDGGNNYWVTDNIGTGKYEDYVYVVRCGDSGAFSSTMFFYVTGTPAPSGGSPLTWYLSSATVYDVDDRDNTNTQGYIPLTSNNYTSYAQAALSGTGFVKISGTTISYDNSTYLTGNQTITLSGDISGTGTTAITTAIGASKVTNTMLAGSIASSKLVGTDIATVGTITSGTWNGTAIGDTYISSAATWNAKQPQLNGTGFVKATGTTISYDNSTYLTGNQTITLSGDISGTGTTAITTAIGALKVTNAMLAGSINYSKMDAATVPTWNQNTTGNAATATAVIATVTGTNSTELVRGNMADNDQFRILVGGTATNAGYVEIATADDATEPIYVRQYTGVFSSLTRTATLLDGSGNTSFPGTVTAAGATFSSNVYSTYNTATGIANNAFNNAKTILGNIHIQNGSGTSGDNKQAAITFQGGTSTEAQAGIYVSNNSSTGTAMGFATTDSYATGPQLFMTATNGGVVNFPRAVPTYAGTSLVYNSGIWSIKIRGTDNTYANGLLQSGAGRADDATGDTWIFVDSLGSDSNKWGIKHNQLSNRIEFWGNNTGNSYIQMDTGVYNGNVTGNVTGNVSGNAATATSATSAGTSTNLYGTGGSYIASSTGGKSYQNVIQVREAGLGGAQGNDMTYAPRLGFHWSAVVASSIAMEASGRIGIFNNPGTAYENFVANIIYANSSFQGNLTGNVTGDVSGNAATAGGLVIETGRNNNANRIVRTDASGYIQCGYINSSNGNENNNANADRVWGTNGSDDYLRTYRTSALSVSYAASAGGVAWGNVSSKPAAWLNATNLTGDNTPNTTMVSGFYNDYAGAGNPVGTWFSYVNVRHTNPANVYGHQHGMSFYDNDFWFRSYSDGSYQSWAKALSSQNYNSYSPTLTGTGASGTWGITITGNAATVTHNASRTDATYYNVGWFAGNPSPAYSCDAVQIQSSTGTLRATAVSLSGDLTVSTSNTTGGGIILADDGDIVDLNDGYCAMRFSLGVRIHAGNRTGAAVIKLGNGGDIVASADITAYGSPSDINLKENIKPLEGALEKIMRLQGVSFTWKEDTEMSKMINLKDDIGFIAQEVQEVIPDLVRKNDNGLLSLRDKGITALLVEAIKEQQQQINELKYLLQNK
jgi:uncharacterized protein YunC (DUF1805 family)